MTNLEIYNAVFADTLELKEADLGDDCTVTSIESWDSISHLTLISALEEKFDIMMDGMDIIEFNSYATGKDILKKYGVEI